MKRNTDNENLIASSRHTVILIIILAVISLMSLNLSGKSSAVSQNDNSHLILYLSVAIAEWALVYYIWIGIRARKRVTLSGLIAGEEKLNVNLKNVLYAIIFWIAANAVLLIVKYFLGVPFISTTNKGILPNSILEYIAFFILALSAGICEEIVYRAYLQKQFKIMLNNRWAAIVLQGFIFGFSHGYQGVKQMFLIFIYGTMFGVLVEIARTVKPAIIAHAWQDIFSGILFPGT